MSDHTIGLMLVGFLAVFQIDLNQVDLNFAGAVYGGLDACLFLQVIGSD